jgi:hypothetical protein
MEELGDRYKVGFAGTLLESVGHTIIPMKVTSVTFLHYADFAMSSYYSLFLKKCFNITASIVYLSNSA